MFQSHQWVELLRPDLPQEAEHPAQVPMKCFKQQFRGEKSEPE